MSRFYGTVAGTARTSASRRGNRYLVTHAASWEGAVRVGLYIDSVTGKASACVSLVPWHGKGTQRLLYDGPLDGSPEEVGDA